MELHRKYSTTEPCLKYKYSSESAISFIHVIVNKTVLKCHFQYWFVLLLIFIYVIMIFTNYQNDDQYLETNPWATLIVAWSCLYQKPYHLAGVDRSWSVFSPSTPPPLPRLVWVSQSATSWVVLVPSSLALAHSTGMILKLHSRPLKSDGGGGNASTLVDCMTC